MLFPARNNLLKAIALFSFALKPLPGMAAIAVKIDFSNVYELEEISEDKRISIFETKLQDGNSIPLQVQISNTAHEKLSSVYNLAFGPLDLNGKINDKAELSHLDYSKVFSTILLAALNYLMVNPTHHLGIDGSTFSRAYLYYKFIQRNYDYLTQHFEISGIKYYVRISRLGKTQYDNPFDFDDILPLPSPIVKNMPVENDKLFNYYIFKVLPQ